MKAKQAEGKVKDLITKQEYKTSSPIFSQRVKDDTRDTKKVTGRRTKRGLKNKNKTRINIGSTKTKLFWKKYTTRL